MSETIPNRSVTERGFTIYDQFDDTYGNVVRVQESSAATDPKVWIFAKNMAAPGEFAAHLNIAQAERVRDALDQWIREQKETLQAESLAAANLNRD